MEVRQALERQWRGGSELPLDLWSGAPLPHDRLATPEAAKKLGLGVGIARWQQHAAFRPSITPFLLPPHLGSPERRRPLVIVAPGGAYVMLSPSEGPPVCRWINSLGFHCALLLYRQLRMHPGPLLDGRRAVQIVRNRSAAWRVDPARVAILGFSAGGHLAGHVALAWNASPGVQADAWLRAAGDSVAWHSAQVTAAVLAYPVASAHNDTVGIVGQGAHRCKQYHCVGGAKRGEGRPIRHHGSIEVLLGPRLGTTLPRARESAISLEDLALARPERPPPFFLWHTANDEIVPSANAERLAAALMARGGVRAAELHVFAGPNPPLRHGLSLALERRLGTFDVTNWTALCAKFLRRSFHRRAGGS